MEVVRCRECKHCDPENYHCDHPMSTAAPLSRKPDDFCSYGERKRRLTVETGNLPVLHDSPRVADDRREGYI